jgi:hypothetical protein
MNVATAVRPDGDGWWWVECDCGQRRGPFDTEPDAYEHAYEHTDECVRYVKAITHPKDAA